MSQKPCSVCRHAQRSEIDLALVGGEATRSIAKRINAKTPIAKPLSHDAILRHKKHVGQAISKALARRGEDPPADALADRLQTSTADTERLEDTLLAKITRLETDARRIGERAESEGDLRAALVANKGLMDVIRLLHDLTPPKTSDADARRVLEWQAEEIGVPVEELVAECERIAALSSDIAAGRAPAHTVRPEPFVPPPAYVAPPPPVVAPVVIPGVPPPLPSPDDAGEVPAGLVLGRRPWHVVI